MDEVALYASFRPASAAGTRLGPRELHIWAIPLHGDPEPFAPLLSAAERQRLDRFRFADHRRRFTIGHGALRAILGGYLGADPAALEFANGPRGKPHLAHPPEAKSHLHFNLTHSGQLALIGLATIELGVDVEKIRHLECLTDIARRHFSEAEFAALDALDGSARELAFYRCWTRKEAYIKALGEGLTMPLDTFDVSVCENPEFKACHDGREDPARWTLLDVSPSPDYVGAAALRAREVPVQRFRLQ
jgi:4'-phosphopantetheinyl transferase